MQGDGRGGKEQSSAEAGPYGDDNQETDNSEAAAQEEEKAPFAGRLRLGGIGDAVDVQLVCG